MRSRAVLLLAASACSGNYRGPNDGGGVDATVLDGEDTGDGATSDGAPSNGDPFPCAADSGCTGGRYCFSTGYMFTSPQAYCCGGASPKCGYAHGSSSGTFYDCVLPGTCSKAEAMCACEMLKASGTCMDAPACPGQAVVLLQGSSCTYWGYAGGAKCKNSGSSAPCDVCPSVNAWY